MIGDNKVLLERDVEKVEPIRFKILVEVLPEKPKSTLLAMPDTLTQGDTTRKAFWAKVVKAGELVDGITTGAVVVMDPSLDIMNINRCFKWQGKHYMLADVSDIIMVTEANNEPASV